MKKKFIGANIALVLGCLVLLAGLSQANSSYLTGGVVMILGSLAYKSAKKRKLGITEPSKTKLVFELIAIAVIVLLTLFSKREYMINDPIPNLVIPILAVVAYVIISAKQTKIIKE